MHSHARDRRRLQCHVANIAGPPSVFSRFAERASGSVRLVCSSDRSRRRCLEVFLHSFHGVDHRCSPRAFGWVLHISRWGLVWLLCSPDRSLRRCLEVSLHPAVRWWLRVISTCEVPTGISDVLDLRYAVATDSRQTFSLDFKLQRQAGTYYFASQWSSQCISTGY